MNTKKTGKDRIKKYGLGSQVGSAIKTAIPGAEAYGAGLDGILGIINTLSNPPQYQKQPTLNAATMRNMVNPYGNFAMGGSLDDLDEEELAALQTRAEEEGLTLEDMLEVVNNESTDTNGDTIDEEDTTDDNSFAYGGKNFAMGGVPIEVEHNEVVETPNGSIKQMKGATHENGGIDIKVPKGTKIFSDRLAIDGKTMQERKISRERANKRLENISKKNPHDSLTKNTLKRVLANNESEDQQDMALQKVANNLYAAPTDETENTEMTAAFGDEVDYPWLGKPFTKKNPSANVLLGGRDPYNSMPIPASPDFNPTATISTNVDNTGLKTLPVPGTISTSGVDTVTPARINNPNQVVANPELSDSNMSIGDYTGIAGNLFNAIAPIINTNNNRRATKPSINRFLGFGKDALDTNNTGQDIAARLQSNELTDIDTAANSQAVRNRNSASSVNTLRALDATTSMARTKARSGATGAYAKQILGLLGDREQLQLNKDKMEMTGSTQRDMEEAANTDNYYSNMAANLTNFGTNIQGLGKNLNTASRNKTDLNLLANEAKNDIAVTSKGNVVNKNLSPKQIQTGLDNGTLVYDDNGNIIPFRKKLFKSKKTK